MTATAPARLRLDAGGAPPPLLEVESLEVVLGRGRRANKVLSGVNLHVNAGEIVGIVGETGSGKTTLARAIVGFVKPRRGRVLFDGVAISGLRGRALRAHRRRGGVQYMFQDPLRSLDPDLTVERIVGEGLAIRGDAPDVIRLSVIDALAQVGLDASLMGRDPGQISGGQRQRVSIARALAAGPRLLICDEPVSALDASNRNHVLNLLSELRGSLNLPIIIISHDLNSLAAIADRVVVLYRGKIVEDGPIDKVFAAPRHPYTALLIASTPHVTQGRGLRSHQLRRQDGEPLPLLGPGACVFAPRCPFALAESCSVQPPLSEVEPGWTNACNRDRDWPNLARGRS
jgi:oligopeptide/dipeptide ABC transporter ATP-binding protein